MPLQMLSESIALLTRVPINLAHAFMLPLDREVWRVSKRKHRDTLLRKVCFDPILNYHGVNDDI